MKFKTLDGAEVIVTLRASKYPIKGKDSCKSALQWRVGQELLRVLKRHIVLEEFSVPGSRLSCDFFIPSLMLVVEADGAQHTKFTAHYHGNMRGFAAAKARDRAKERWCELNGISMIRVTRSEDVEGAIREEFS
jgi:hypothetical protein